MPNFYAGLDTAANRQITSALVSTSIRPSPDSDGGEVGCRTSNRGVGIGMLDYVFWLPRDDFFPQETPDLSNPPKSTRIGTLRIEDRLVRLSEFLRLAHPPLDIPGASRGGITLALDTLALEALQAMVDRGAPKLNRFDLYLVGTNGGSTGANQTCIDYFEDIRLTVFYRDET